MCKLFCYGQIWSPFEIDWWTHRDMQTKHKSKHLTLPTIKVFALYTPENNYMYTIVNVYSPYTNKNAERQVNQSNHSWDRCPASVNDGLYRVSIIEAIFILSCGMLVNTLYQWDYSILLRLRFACFYSLHGGYCILASIASVMHCLREQGRSKIQRNCLFIEILAGHRPFSTALNTARSLHTLSLQTFLSIQGELSSISLEQNNFIHKHKLSHGFLRCVGKCLS